MPCRRTASKLRRILLCGKSPKHPDVFALSNPIITSRQAHSRRAQIDVDVCAALDVDLELDAIIIAGLPLVTGHLDVCLCISVLPVFVKVDVAAKAAVAILGEVQVIAILEGLILAADGHQTCQYPPHSKAICDVHDPCKFECIDGYQPLPSNRPRSCVCPTPSTVCNGKCGSFPNGCGTALPMFRRNVPSCEPGIELCGVPNRSKAWECIDTRTNLESCGGCTSPYTSSINLSHGTDCSAILHVSDVSCEKGKCRVEKCLPGFIPNEAADACVQQQSDVHGNGVFRVAIPTSEGVATREDVVGVKVNGALTGHVNRDNVGATQRNYYRHIVHEDEIPTRPSRSTRGLIAVGAGQINGDAAGIVDLKAKAKGIVGA